MSVSLIQTNVLTFREIPGRRRTFKRGAFDVLSCVFKGPTSLKDQFLPRIDSQSLPYPFMLVTGVSDVDMPGSITEVTVSYQGLMNVNGAQSPAVVSTRQVETSGSFPTKGFIVATPGTDTYKGVPDGLGDGGINMQLSGINVNEVLKIGVWTTNVRYLSKQAIIKYQSLVRVTSPMQESIAAPIAGYTILSQDRAQLTGINQTNGFPLINLVVTSSFSMICTDFSVDQVAASLFDCSETWEWKYVNSVNWGNL